MKSLTIPGAAERFAATEDAFADPRVGDEFEEFLSHWVIVIGRNGDRVAWVNAWGGGRETYVGSCDELRAMYAYRSIPGYSVNLERRGRDVTGWMTAEVAACLAVPRPASVEKSS